MPLYDCMLLMKARVTRESMMDLVTRVGKHVYSRNGVVTEIKSFGKINLGYGVKKLDGRHFQGQLMQMTMMTPPTINEELHYLNKEDRLLRWILVKHRDVKFGLESLGDDDESSDILKRPNLFVDGEDEDDDDDIVNDEDEDDEEYEVEEQQQGEETKA